MTDLLFLDRDLAVSVKPSGLLSEGQGKDTFPTLLSQALREKKEPELLYPIHRLDRQTEGLMVFARTKEAAAALSDAMARGAFQKEYLAVAHGTPAQKSGALQDLLFYDRQRGKSYVTDRRRKGVKEASLDFCVLAEQNGLSLLHIILHTGRTHQIRVQLASRSLPLCADRAYGAPASSYSFGLCAAKLTLPHPRTGETMTFTCRPTVAEEGEKVSPFAVFAPALLTL